MFEWCGIHSLEIYLLHGYFLNQLKLLSVPNFEYAVGLMLVLANFTITVVAVKITLTLLNQSPVLKYALFGKTS